MLTKNFFLFQNVFVLFSAKERGSPSIPALAGNLSTSSASKILIGLELNPVGELAPTIAIYPPGNPFSSNVLSLSLAFASLTFPFNAGVSLIIVANLFLE